MFEVSNAVHSEFGRINNTTANRKKKTYWLEIVYFVNKRLGKL
jgi:hypothetical protein